MRRECRERFPCHQLKKKPLISDSGMYHGTCVTHVPWCMSGSLNRGGGENVPGIPGACATRIFTYLARVPWGDACYSAGWHLSTSATITQKCRTQKWYSYFWCTIQLANPDILYEAAWEVCCDWQHCLATNFTKTVKCRGNLLLSMKKYAIRRFHHWPLLPKTFYWNRNVLVWLAQ